jgi:sec-independent protein translocase protein TatA
MGNIGPLEIGIVLVILLVIFGPKRLPGLGKSLGTGLREFKDTITGSDKDDDDDDKPAITQAEATDAAAAAPAAPETPTPVPTDPADKTPTGS